MNVKLMKNTDGGKIAVFVGHNRFGSMDNINADEFAYFPEGTRKLTGDDFIAIGKKLNELNDNPCKLCKHNGGQGVLNSGCTGCSVDKEFGHFAPIEQGI